MPIEGAGCRGELGGRRVRRRAGQHSRRAACQRWWAHSFPGQVSVAKVQKIPCVREQPAVMRQLHLRGTTALNDCT